MVLLASLISFFWVDRSLVGFQIEQKQYDSRDNLAFFQNLYLSEVICGRERKTVVCSSYLLRV